MVSPVHANFIVTEGENARAEDALALAEEIRERVKREQGIELEYEVELWRANEPTDETSGCPTIRLTANGAKRIVREQVIAQKVGNRSGMAAKRAQAATAQRPRVATARARTHLWACECGHCLVTSRSF